MGKRSDGDKSIVKYKLDADSIVETTWPELDPRVVIEAHPWRRFPWFVGKKNFSGMYWAATEGALVGYESLLELSWLTMLDFDSGVKRIASQPFHLIMTHGGRRLKRTVDYLALTDDGPLIVDVKRADEREKPDVREVLDLTRAVVEARGWRYEIGCEPDEVRYANIKFLAGYRRYWLFEEKVTSTLRESVARMPGQSIRDVLGDVAVDRYVAKAALMHLLWTQQVRADLSKRLSMNTEVEMAP